MLNDPLFIIAALACAVVGVILILGISNFGKEGIDAAKRSNKFMRWRIIAQFIAVVLILLFVYIRRQMGGE
ncbi:twin transmembrane helix small protein [Roseovarius sp.]|uniref:twin transmembrane helix small protein n=1 Tax=Roseovarius sp. TaxID=1486281 RepID=UPI003D119B93